uniref:(northern house mosquito) hypothetical protein n=1 Tax=Culex pipiens TaxID=7175 RepID=A0A8D8F9B9_CULPI
MCLLSCCIRCSYKVERLRLQAHVAVLDQILHQPAEDHIRRDALRQQLVQPLADRFQLCRTLLLHNLVRRLPEEHLPVNLRHVLPDGERILLHLARLQHQNVPAHFLSKF